jgi:hypothetical protein
VCVLDIVDERGPLTLDEVGEVFGVTRERIRQIELKALMKLKKRPQVVELGRDADALPRPARRGRVVPRPGECTVSGCGRRIRARGLCAAHHQRWMRARPPSFETTAELS